jgi:hypothetical protein
MNTKITAQKEDRESDLLDMLLENRLVLDKNDALKSEHDILLEEYKMMKSEILQLLQEARQITNLTLTTIGIIVAGIAAALQIQIRISPQILLFLPFIFYFFTCIQLRYVFHVLDMGRYLSDITIPQIHNNLAKSLPTRRSEIFKLLSWEMPRQTPLRKRGWTFFPIAAASYGMPFLFSVALIVLYFWLFSNLRLSVNFENILLIINGVSILYCGWWALEAERKR